MNGSTCFSCRWCSVARPGSPKRASYGGPGPVGIVGVGDVEEDEEGHVAVSREPGQEPIHVLTSGLAALAVGQGSLLVKLLEALVEVGEAADEEDRRETGRGVARLTEDLGQGDGRAGQTIAEVGDPMGGGVERSEQGGCRDLGPGGLNHGILEEGALGGQTIDDRARGPRVPVGAEVVAPQRVRPDDDHAPRPAREAALRVRGAGHGAQVPHHGRAPKADASGGGRNQGEGETDLSAREP